MKQGKGLARKSGLKASKPMKARNPKRRASLFAKQFGSRERVEAIRALVCYVCQKEPAENAHLKSRATGGTWRDIVDLGAKCHRTAKDSLHNCGSVEAFEACHPGIDLRARAKFLAEYLHPGRLNV